MTHYTYEAAGNCKQMTSTLAPVPPGLLFYNADDQLASDTCDANGNTANPGETGYVYDFENRLIQKDGIDRAGFLYQFH